MSDIVDLIEATVRLEQPLQGRERTVGTGFVVTAVRADGAPRTVLITANHVFENMPNDRAQVGFRERTADGDWRFEPASVRIRGPAGEPLWTRHPTQDVAAIELPPGVAPAALPVADIGGERTLQALGVRPGDEMMVLGFPIGVSANPAGFPILRAGRVASYPLSPASRYPTYLVDFNVFGGNSGGPVYAVRRAGAARQVVITGLLTQQIEFEGERLQIGNVTQADFIGETLSLLTGELAVVSAGEGEASTFEPTPASSGPRRSAWDRLAEAWAALVDDFQILVRRAWIVAREAVMHAITPDPRRAG
jgi:hypothetical protein